MKNSILKYNLAILFTLITGTSIATAQQYTAEEHANFQKSQYLFTELLRQHYAGELEEPLADYEIEIATCVANDPYDDECVDTAITGTGLRDKTEYETCLKIANGDEGKCKTRGTLCRSGNAECGGSSEYDPVNNSV